MGRSFGCIDWHQRHVRVLSALSSGRPAYGVFVAAVVTMASLLARAVRLLPLKCRCMFCGERSYNELRTRAMIMFSGGEL